MKLWLGDLQIQGDDCTLKKLRIDYIIPNSEEHMVLMGTHEFGSAYMVTSRKLKYIYFLFLTVPV